MQKTKESWNIEFVAGPNGKKLLKEKSKLEQYEQAARGLPITSVVYRALRHQTGLNALKDPNGNIKPLGDLFILDQTGGGCVAYPSYALGQHRDRLMRGHSSEDLVAAKVEDALMLLGYYSVFDFEEYSPTERAALEREVFYNLANALGESVIRTYIAQTKERSEIEAGKVSNILNKALSGIVRMHHHVPARNTGDPVPRAVIAIECAADLCARFKRLPTKKELRAAMEAIGITYKLNPKDPNGKWNGLFSTATLDTLPDSPPPR